MDEYRGQTGDLAKDICDVCAAHDFAWATEQDIPMKDRYGILLSALIYACWHVMSPLTDEEKLRAIDKIAKAHYRYEVTLAETDHEL